MEIVELTLTPETVDALIALSADWEAEGSCRGYHTNAAPDIEGRRAFAALEDGRIIGYRFGRMETAKNSSSAMPEGAPFFEVEELYVRPEHRSKGVGRALFKRCEASADGADYLALSTATRDWRAIMHFYIDEMGMEFWNARLFKPLRGGDESDVHGS